MPDTKPNSLQDDVVQNSAQGSQFADVFNKYLESKGKKLSDYERKRNRMLGSQTAEGLTGLNYLTGNKKPEVETFYDAHPAQAVTSNLARNAPTLGAAVAGGGVLHNLFKDMMSERAFNAAGDKLRDDGAHIDLDATKAEKIPGDVASIFGRPGDKLRESRLTAVNGNSDTLSGFAKFHQTLGKTKPEFDEERLLRKVEVNLPKFLGGRSGHEGHHPELLKDILAQHLGGNDDKAKNVANKYLERYGRNSVREVTERGFGKRVHNPAVGAPKYENSLPHELVKMLPKGLQDMRIDPAMLRQWSRIKNPLIAGTAIAGTGLALSPILSMLQKHMYGDKKVKEWTNAARMVKGRFDAVEK